MENTPEQGGTPIAQPAVGETSAAPNTTPTVDNGTLMAILAYLGPLVIIPFLTAKGQPFVAFHIKQGLVLFGIEIILWIIDEIMILGPLYLLVSLVNLGLIILTIIGIINVVQKKETELPLIGAFAHKFNI